MHATVAASWPTRLLGTSARRHYPTVVVVAVTLAAAFIFFQAMRDGTEGRLGPPVDDAYIYFNYARHMAAGSLYQYNPGDGVSTGATSLLWTPVLALGHRVGFRGESMMLWAFGLGTLCLLGYGLLLLRMSQQLLRSRALGTLLAAALVLDGRVLWGFFSGMEIGLYLLSEVATCYALWIYQQHGRSRDGWLLVLSASVLVLIRPEGQFLGAFVALVFVAWKWLAARGNTPPRPWHAILSRREWVGLGVPVALVAAQYLFMYVATGYLSQNGMRTKSHLYAPDADLWGILKASFQFYRDMIFRHFPWLFDKSLRHVMDLFFFFGFVYGMAREARRRRPSLMWLLGLWFFGGLAIQSLVLNAAYHHGRYQMNYTFVFWLVFVWGVQLTLTLLPIRRQLQRFALGAGLSLLVLMMLNSVVIFRPIYRKDCLTIHTQQAAAGRFIAEHLPTEAAVGLNDAGAIAYYGKRYVYDLFGLTTNLAARWKWLGEACIWEQVQHLEPDSAPRRPDYLAIYDKWYPRITSAGFLEQLARFQAPKGSIAGGPLKTVYRIEWEKLGDKSHSLTIDRDRVERGLRVVDRLDVAYRPDEIAHDHTHWVQGRPSERGSALVVYARHAGAGRGLGVADGGRHIKEREALTVRGVAPDRPLVLIRRTTGTCGAVHVRVDGRDAGTWGPTRGSDRSFREDHFELSPELLAGPEIRLDFRVAAPDTTEDEPADEPGKKKQGKKKKRPDGGYRAFYYWFAQL